MPVNTDTNFDASVIYSPIFIIFKYMICVNPFSFNNNIDFMKTYCYNNNYKIRKEETQKKMEAEVSYTSILTALMLTSVPGSAMILYLRFRKAHFSKWDVTLLLAAFGMLAARLFLPVEILTVTHSVYVTAFYADFCDLLNCPLIGKLPLVGCLIILSLAGTVILCTLWISRYRNTARLIRRGKLTGYHTAGGKDLPVIESRFVTHACLIGLLHPAIILPSELHGNRDDIILHEANHYIHHDLPVKYVFELLCMVFWWNPLVWLISRQAGNMLELRNDFHTTAGFSMERKLRYAETLLAEARKQTGHRERNQALAGIGLDASESLLRTRIHSILNAPPGRQTLLPALILMGTLLLSFGVIIEPSSPPDGGEYYHVTRDSFFIDNGETYELYLDGDYVLDYTRILPDFSELPIYKKGDYHDKKNIFNLIRRYHRYPGPSGFYISSPLCQP